jgi:hypothetical protein
MVWADKGGFWLCVWLALVGLVFVWLGGCSWLVCVSVGVVRGCAPWLVLSWLCFPSRCALWLNIFACAGFLALGWGSCKGYALKCDYRRFLRLCALRLCALLLVREPLRSCRP